MVLGRFANNDRWTVHGDRGVPEIRLPEEVQRRTIRGGQAVNDLISTNLLEVMAMVTTSARSRV